MPAVNSKPPIPPGQKRFAYLMLRGGASQARTSEQMQTWFGLRSRPPSHRTLERIRRIGDLTGDPCYTPPRSLLGRSLTYAHKKLILDELTASCTVSTRELVRKLRAAEQSARTQFAHSTIDDAIRAAMITSKRVTVYNIRRDAFESAQARVAIGRYPIECVLYLDASHIAGDENDRRMGRSRRGRQAVSRRFECAGGQLCSFLGAFSIDGFEMGCCEVVEGTIDTPRYVQWLCEKVSRVVNPFDGRYLRNSVIVMVRLPVCLSVCPSVSLSVFVPAHCLTRVSRRTT
jgi:hypothetical protein